LLQLTANEGGVTLSQFTIVASKLFRAAKANLPLPLSLIERRKTSQASMMVA